MVKIEFSNPKYQRNNAHIVFYEAFSFLPTSWSFNFEIRFKLTKNQTKRQNLKSDTHAVILVMLNFVPLPMPSMYLRFEMRAKIKSETNSTTRKSNK